MWTHCRCFMCGVTCFRATAIWYCFCQPRPACSICFPYLLQKVMCTVLLYTVYVLYHVLSCILNCMLFGRHKYIITHGRIHTYIAHMYILLHIKHKHKHTRMHTQHLHIQYPHTHSMRARTRTHTHTQKCWGIIIPTHPHTSTHPYVYIIFLYDISSLCQIQNSIVPTFFPCNC